MAQPAPSIQMIPSDRRLDDGNIHPAALLMAVGQARLMVRAERL